MIDSSSIREAHIKVKEAILADYPLDMIEEAVRDMLVIFDNEEGDLVTSFDELQLALDIQETGILLSLMKGDMDTVAINSMDELEKATGYTRDEISVMLSYADENIVPLQAD